MPVEEIKLGLPGNTSRDEPSDQPERVRNDLIRQYRQISSARRRFAWTRRQRERREAEFNVASRNIVKRLARELTTDIQSRGTRVLVRAEIYATVTALLSTACHDQRLDPDRVQMRNRFGLAVAALALVGLLVLLNP
jgi:hypothetical protein